MKKILLSMVLLTICNSIFAFATMGNWRWRNDDGTETTATWKAAQNVPIVISSTTQTLRLRIELYNDSTNAGGTLDNGFFEVSKDSLNWDTIKVTADATIPFVLVGTDPNVTNLEPTTEQLSNKHSLHFQPGHVIDSSYKYPVQTVSAKSGTEVEYVFKPTAQLQPSTKYYFRFDAANYTFAYVFPTLTTASSLPVKLYGFAVTKNAGKAQLDWNTASEENNDHFDVQKSTDLKTWNTFETVKGNGTSSQVHSYQAVDASPVNGLNYYRLKQVDKDGNSTFSDVKSLRFGIGQNAIISVSPNPSHGIVNFKLQNSSANNVSVLLVGNDGRIIHQEVFSRVEDGVSYKLNFKNQPAPGVYILTLKSDGLSQSSKIVIQ